MPNKWQVIPGVVRDQLMRLDDHNNLVPMAVGRTEVIVPLAQKLNEIDARPLGGRRDW